jgi:hypothetical protein
MVLLKSKSMPRGSYATSKLYNLPLPTPEEGRQDYDVLGYVNGQITTLSSTAGYQCFARRLSGGIAGFQD